LDTGEIIRGYKRQQKRKGLGEFHALRMYGDDDHDDFCHRFLLKIRYTAATNCNRETIAKTNPIDHIAM
jgi:hypothetical protein